MSDMKVDVDLLTRLQEAEDTVDQLQQTVAGVISGHNALNKAYVDLETLVNANKSVLQSVVGGFLGHLDAHAQHAPLSAGKPGIIIEG